ncbi:MAG: thiamine biosynthesis protein ApbE [Methylophilales bacterium 16-45-7]|jgi:thiamine biosynthesis lipoprotein|nr:MAG: thiamine biosynthesis protein ApbE [Methylophilales bacterium 16-45-7]
MRYFILLFAFLTQTSCVPLDPLYHTQTYIFGTLVDISIYGEDETQAQFITSQITREFQQIHNRLHAWKPSELNGINKTFADERPKIIEPDMVKILEDVTQLSMQSEGMFNPAIGKLIQAWGFQRDEFTATIPDQATLKTLLGQQPNMQDIVINGRQITSKNPNVKLDLGGYAKGYALDVGLKILNEFHVKNALINIGGNVIALGKHGDNPWVVGIQHPRKPDAIATIALESGWAIGTSGDYQRYFMQDGQRYCHIIDPRTGHPAQGTQSVTVLIPPGLRAGVLSDVASKPIFISPLEQKAEFTKKMEVTHVLVIQEDGQIYVTPQMQQRLSWLDQDAKKRIRALQ